MLLNNFYTKKDFLNELDKYFKYDINDLYKKVALTPQTLDGFLRSAIVFEDIILFIDYNKDILIYNYYLYDNNREKNYLSIKYDLYKSNYEVIVRHIDKNIFIESNDIKKEEILNYILNFFIQLDNKDKRYNRNLKLGLIGV